MAGGLLLTGVGILFLPLAHGATLLSVVLLVAQQLVADGAATVFEINQVSLRQRITPVRVLGRVSAGTHVAAHGAALAGALIGGVLGQVLGLRAALVAGSLAAFLAAAALMFSPVQGIVEATPAPKGQD